MRRALLLLAIAGCGFKHGALDPMVADDASPPEDAAIDAAADAMIDARVVVIVPYCNTQDPNLVACYQFENNTNDSSGHNLNASMTNVTFSNGKVGMALNSAANSATDVADSTMWNLNALTIEAWINPSALPGTGLRMGIVDVEGQYGFFLHETGRLRSSTASRCKSTRASRRTRGRMWRARTTARRRRSTRTAPSCSPGRVAARSRRMA
jgi:hypothetical protein